MVTIDEIEFKKILRMEFSSERQDACFLDKSQGISTSNIFGFRIIPRLGELTSEFVQHC